MWPDIAEWFRKMAGQASQSVPQTYQDSVMAITGRPALGLHYVPSAVVKMFAMNPGADGAYNPMIPAAMVQNYADDPYRKDWVTAHELGHRYDLSQSGDPQGLRQAFDSARAVNPAPGGYAASSRDEHFAEAFAQAIQTLRDTGSNELGQMTPRVARSWLSDADGTVPGSVALMKVLLKNPMYANHPMQQFTGMMAMPYSQLTQPYFAVKEFHGAIPR